MASGGAYDPSQWARQRQEKVQRAAQLKAQRNQGQLGEEHTFTPQLSRRGSESSSRLPDDARALGPPGPAAYDLSNPALMRNAYPEGAPRNDALDVFAASRGGGAGGGGGSRANAHCGSAGADAAAGAGAGEDALGNELQRRPDVRGARRGSDLAHEVDGADRNSRTNGNSSNGGGFGGGGGGGYSGGSASSRGSGISAKPRRRQRPEWDSDTAVDDDAACVEPVLAAATAGRRRGFRDATAENGFDGGRHAAAPRCDNREWDDGGGVAYNSPRTPSSKRYPGNRSAVVTAAVTPDEADRAEMIRDLSALKLRMRRESSPQAPSPRTRMTGSGGAAGAGAAAGGVRRRAQSDFANGSGGDNGGGGRGGGRGGRRGGGNNGYNGGEDAYARTLGGGGRTAPANLPDGGAGRKAVPPAQNNAHRNGGSGQWDRDGNGDDEEDDDQGTASAAATAPAQRRAPAAAAARPTAGRSAAAASYNTGDGGGASAHDPPEFVDAPTELKPCPDCGRKFGPEALQRHVRICKQVFMEKRKAFDTTQQRVQGTELAKYVLPTRRKGKGAAATGNTNGRSAAAVAAKPLDDRPVGPPGSGRGGGGGGSASWRQQSSALRDAMKQARMVTAAQKAGRSLSDLPSAAPSAPDPSLVLCDNCGRRFNEMAAARHIPKCKEIRAKPTSLKKGSGTLLGVASRGSTGGGSGTKPLRRAAAR